MATDTPTKTVRDCQHDAVLLKGLIEGLDLMENEGPRFENARVSLTMVALQWAQQLADDLDNAKVIDRSEP